jgi:hypothetical protein
MKFRFTKCLLVLVTIAVWEWGVRPLLAPESILAQTTPPDKDNEELTRICAEDQKDRMPEAGKEIDWKVVQPRDQQREKRVKEIYEKGDLQTSADYFHAALVLQHASKPEDYLLAHELSVVAAVKGTKSPALWLAAASEDRFLMNIGRPQRFGTQYASVPGKSGVSLYQVGPGVTDKLRKEFRAPTLAEAKAREATFNKKP